MRYTFFFSKYQFIWTGDTQFLLVFDAPTSQKDSQTNPITCIFRYLFDLHPPVVRPVSVPLMSPTRASRNFRTPADRSATPYNIGIFCQNIKIIHESRVIGFSVGTPRQKPNFRMRGKFRIFHQNVLLFSK